MKCDECLELLTSVLFEETEGDKELSLHEHLAGCDSCREEYMELVETKAQLESTLKSSVDAEGLSPAQKLDIMASIGEDGAGKAPFVIPPWVFAVAACIVIAVIVGLKMAPESPSMAKSEKMEKQNSIMPAAEVESYMVQPEEKKEARSFKLSDEEAVTINNKLKKRAEAPKALKEDLADKKVEVVKAKKKQERKAPAAVQMLSEPAADSAVMEVSPFTVQMLRKMLKSATLKDSAQLTNLKALTETVKSLKNSQIQVRVLPQNVGSKNAPQKILIRISKNGDKAIDYAHIFVHNQSIIQVERVK